MANKTVGEVSNRKLYDTSRHAYCIEKHEGLVRFYKDTRKIPTKRCYAITAANIKAGRIGAGPNGEPRPMQYRTFLTFTQEWFEQDHWAWDDKTGNVYRIKMKDCHEVERKLCGNVSTAYSREAVLAQILDRDITIQQAYNSQDKHSRPKQIGAADVQLNTWSKEFDGKSIMALCILKPKMSFNEIKAVIESEGGSVDSQGIIHKA